MTRDTQMTHMYLLDFSSLCPGALIEIMSTQFRYLKEILTKNKSLGEVHFCDFIFLAKHLGEKNFKCEKCDMAFACNSLRYHHIQKVHDGIEFRCHLCGKDFAYKKGLRRHIKNVHDGAQLLDARRRLHHSQIPTYNNSPMTLSPTQTS